MPGDKWILVSVDGLNIEHVMRWCAYESKLVEVLSGVQ